MPLPPGDLPERVVCLSPIPWAGLWTSRHELTKELAARGHPVLFVDPPANALRRRGREPGTRPVPDGLAVVTPPPYWPYGVLASMPRMAGAVIDVNARRYARFVVSVVRRDRPVLLVNSFMPVLGYRVAGALGPDAHLYHRADELRSFPSFQPAYLEYERRVLRQADVVACVSEPVRDGVADVRPDAVVLRNGVDPARFAAAGPDPRVAAVRDDRPERPVALLVGRVDHRMDAALLAAAASVATVVIAGEVVDERMVPAGAVRLGPVPPEEVPGLMAAADVAVAPYAEFPGDPLKVYEYLAAGLPVVASPAPGLRQSPVAAHLDFQATPADFATAVERAARNRTDADDRVRRAAAAEQSWRNRTTELLRLVHAATSRGPA